MNTKNENTKNGADGTSLPSAVVVPFPVRRAKPGPEAHARLARALESLDAALKNQRQAVAAWRDVLKDLKSTTANLDESLQRYRTTLRSLGSSVSALQTKARALEAWADKASQSSGATLDLAQPDAAASNLPAAKLTETDMAAPRVSHTKN